MGSSLLFGVSLRTSQQFVSQLCIWTAKSKRHKLMPLIAGLTFWTDDINSKQPAHSYTYYAGIYALLQISAMISLLLLGVAIFIVSVKRAGANIHREALRSLIQAPLHFFTQTDTGVVTNLFSQDLNLIDTELPEATINTLVCVSPLSLDPRKEHVQ